MELIIAWIIFVSILLFITQFDEVKRKKKYCKQCKEYYYD
jgi:hypothetical protein